MASHQYFTRAFSENSAGKLVCGRGSRRPNPPISEAELLREFTKHNDLYNREPTALVSVSDRIVDTVKRAFDKHYKDGESPEDIWVLFIEVPTTRTILDLHPRLHRIHSTQELATKCGFTKPELFAHEFVFEWEIPSSYEVWRVSLQTLMDRGLDWEQYTNLSTWELRSQLATELPWKAEDVAITRIRFAQKFGALSPYAWIARQYFRDCCAVDVKPLPLQGEFEFKYANGSSRRVHLSFRYRTGRTIANFSRNWFQEEDLISKRDKYREMKKTVDDQIQQDYLGQAGQDFEARHERYKAVLRAQAVEMGF